MNNDTTLEQTAQPRKRRTLQPEKVREELNIAKSDDDLLTTDEVALWTGFCKQALEGWRSRRNGGPVFIKFGQKVMYRRGDVKAWIDSKRVTPTTTN